MSTDFNDFLDKISKDKSLDVESQEKTSSTIPSPKKKKEKTSKGKIQASSDRLHVMITGEDYELFGKIHLSLVKKTGKVISKSQALHIILEDASKIIK